MYETYNIDIFQSTKAIEQYACEHGQYKICAFLINHGADIDDVAPTNHVTNDSDDELYTE